MMMTVASDGAPGAVKYKNTMDAFRQVIAKEGASSMFKGAGANILRWDFGICTRSCSLSVC